MKKINKILLSIIAASFIIGSFSMFIKDVFLEEGTAENYLSIMENTGLAIAMIFGIILMVVAQTQEGKD